jgi:pyruvoyl-dependent arginine decarboxylase (PvlArgDC)
MANEFQRQYAKEKRIFSRFKEKGKITGLSVTRALLSNNPEAKKSAKILLENLAKNAALGIAALTQGKGYKENWSEQQKNYWRNLDFVFIGGGVSEGLTGKILVDSIKKYLPKKSLSDIKVYQAKFPGKEAGFLGAVINIVGAIRQEAKQKGKKVIAAIGLDLGREEIGVGLLAINHKSGKIVRQRKNYWLFRQAVKTPDKSYLKVFLDSRRGYTRDQKVKGKQIRTEILRKMADLVIQAQNKAQKMGLRCAQNIAVAVPGSASPSGYILNSTDYLPFFKKQDGFNFARSLENSLAEKRLPGYRVHIVNDGIAAGIANAYFELSKIKSGKFAFLGAGSGLGGCVGRVMIR